MSGYTSVYIPANASNRTYGGVGAIVAQVVGMWDALLGEGRRIWTIADSGSHFEIDVNTTAAATSPASTRRPMCGWPTARSASPA